MKDLSRHIEYLLLEHDCVVIPQFGALVSQDMPAEYSSEENLFIPPYRTVRYLSDVQEDDGVLRNCLVNLHHINQNVAERWINEYVDYINQSLMESGEMDFGTIGNFVIDNGRVQFQPCQAGVNTPNLYGLDTFQLTMLPIQTLMPRTNRRHYSIQISQHVARFITATAAVVILAALILIPSHIGTDNNIQFARFFDFDRITQWFNTSTDSDSADYAQQSQPVVQARNIRTITVVKHRPHPDVQPEIQQDEVVPVQEESETVTSPAGSCIVLASAITETRADEYVADLIARGYDNACKVVRGKMVRVVLRGYETEAIANEKAAALRQDAEFSDVWVINIK